MGVILRVNKVSVHLKDVCEQLSDNKLIINKAVEGRKFWITVSVLNTARMYKQTNYTPYSKMAANKLFFCLHVY